MTVSVTAWRARFQLFGALGLAPQTLSRWYAAGHARQLRARL